MKILLSNKFYYPRGGDCIYTIELEKLLKTKGHQVAIFSMQHPENLPTEYDKYFPSETIFSVANKQNFVETLLRPYGTQEVISLFLKLLNDFKPDVIHVNNIHTQLSPIIIRLSKEQNIPVVWTLHDYKLLCPASAFLKTNATICESCLAVPHSVVKNRCIKGSLPASLLGYWEAKKWNKDKLQLYTNTFIAPSLFLKEKMEQGGYLSSKIIQLYNFANDEKFEHVVIKKRINEVLFVGRLSVEKGVGTLCKAFQKVSNAKLIIIGDGPLKKKLSNEYASEKIQFMGFQSWETIKDKLSHSSFLVVPSQWYENNPLTIIESLSLGTPILGSRIGGIPELIENRINGMTFQAGDVMDLIIKINEMLNYKDWNYQQIQSDAYTKFSADNYYKQILKIYNNSLLNGNYQ